MCRSTAIATSVGEALRYLHGSEAASNRANDAEADAVEDRSNAHGDAANGPQDESANQHQ